MKQFEIAQDGKTIDTFDELTYKKAMKQIGKKYAKENVVLSYTNKQNNRVTHKVTKGGAK